MMRVKQANMALAFLFMKYFKQHHLQQSTIKTPSYIDGVLIDF